MQRIGGCFNYTVPQYFDYCIHGQCEVTQKGIVHKGTECQELFEIQDKAMVTGA